MELMGVPSRILENTYLREPLTEEVVVVNVAGAREWPWNLGAPFDVDIHHSVRRDRLRQRHRRNGAVRGIAIVRRDEPNARRQVVAPVERDTKRLDVGRTPCIR